MSVVGYIHFRLGVMGKIILNALILLPLTATLLCTIVGTGGCKNVDKVSDTLIFRYNEDNSITSLDPAYVKSQGEIWIASQIYNGLVELDSQLLPSPMLARNWEILKDGLVYKFHLRRGVQFHAQWNKGNEQAMFVTAYDVAYSFARLLDPATASPGAWIFSDKVESAEKAFVAENDSTFVLSLKKPFPAMLSLLSTTYCYVVPKKIVQGNETFFGRHPVGTGPFYMKLWEEDVKMVLRRNPVYFEKEGKKSLPYLEAVNIDFIKSKQTAFMRFVAGEYDFFNGVEASFKDELLESDGTLKAKFNKRFKMIQKPFLNTEYLGFWLDSIKDRKKNILQNVHLRRAMSYAVDRVGLVRYLRNGAGVGGENGFVPPVLLDRNVNGFSFDAQKALEEMKLAGFSYKNPCPELTLTTTADYLDYMVYLKKFWADIGITVNIEVQTSGMLRQMRSKGNVQIFRGSWIADFADPENYLSCFYSKNFSPNGPNYTHYKNPFFDKLYENVAFGALGENRIKLAAQADSLMIQDAPIIVLYYDKSIRLFHNNVLGLTNDASNRLQLKKVKKRVKS